MSQDIKNPLFVVFCGVFFALFYLWFNTQILILVFIVTGVSGIFFRKRIFVVLAYSFFCALIYSGIYFSLQFRNLDFLLDKKTIYFGSVMSDAKPQGFYIKSFKFLLDGFIDETGAYKKIKSEVLVNSSFFEEYEIGDFIQIKGEIVKPEGALLPGMYDEKKRLLIDGINYKLKSSQGGLVYLGENKSFLILKRVNQLRKRFFLHNKINLSKNLNECFIVDGIIFGSKASDLSKELKDKFRSLGLSHITAASGFNVSILSGFIFFVFNFLIRKNRRLKIIPYAVSFFAVVFYSAMADFSPSILRASIFIILVLISNFLSKKLKIIPVVSLILLLFFFSFPLSLMDVGLQLSVFAFLGLALFYGIIQDNIFQYISNYLKLPISILLQTLIAQIFVMPLILFYFHNIQILSLVSNLFAIPISVLILFTGIVYIISSAFFGLNFISVLIAQALIKLASIFLAWVNFLYLFQFKEFLISRVNLITITLLYLLIFSIFILLLNPKNKTLKFLVLSSIILIFANIYFFSQDRKLKIFCLSKYNIDSILVVLPVKDTYLFSNRISPEFLEDINYFIQLNGLSGSLRYFTFNNTENVHNEFINNLPEKVTVKYKEFLFESYKDYPISGTENPDFIKLPIMKKSDPTLNSVLTFNPAYLIVNDNKKLSKKSLNDKLWLKKNFNNIYFLSETGTIALVTDGCNHKVIRAK